MDGRPVPPVVHPQAGPLAGLYHADTLANLAVLQAASGPHSSPPSTPRYGQQHHAATSEQQHASFHQQQHNHQQSQVLQHQVHPEVQIFTTSLPDHQPQQHPVVQQQQQQQQVFSQQQQVFSQQQQMFPQQHQVFQQQQQVFPQQRVFSQQQQMPQTHVAAAATSGVVGSPPSVHPSQTHCAVCEQVLGHKCGRYSMDCRCLTKPCAHPLVCNACGVFFADETIKRRVHSTRIHETQHHHTEDFKSHCLACSAERYERCLAVTMLPDRVGKRKKRIRTKRPKDHVLRHRADLLSATPETSADELDQFASTSPGLRSAAGSMGSGLDLLGLVAQQMQDATVDDRPDGGGSAGGEEGERDCGSDGVARAASPSSR